jgi:GNAT superfamily N-acetyltransferase
MNVAATPSPWDSAVFERRVGLLKGDELAPIEDIAKDGSGKFDVIFAQSPKWIEFPSLHPEPPGLDYLYDMELGVHGHATAFNDVVSVHSNANHVRIAKTAFPDSRFLRDSRLAQHTPNMYEQWMGLGRKSVFVIANTPDDGFLLEGRDDDGALRISLIAVSEDCRGSGAGRFLVSGVLGRWPGTWRVKVSARNHRAIRFYEKIGFRVKEVWTAFHVWPEDYK